MSKPNNTFQGPRGPVIQAAAAEGGPPEPPAGSRPVIPARSLASSAFYVRALRLLREEGIPHLVGGAFALAAYTGIVRDTKDLDVFMRPGDCARTLEVFARAGYDTELTDPVWLGKARSADYLVDIIFNGANTLSEVTDTWFEHAPEAEVLGMRVLLCPPEELIVSKGYVMERDRFDGHDVAHILRARARQMDWPRLLGLFGRHWRVLMAHLVLFGYIYPSERDAIPTWVMDTLLERMKEQVAAGPTRERTCRGTLLSRVHYDVDVGRWGYHDARVGIFGNRLPDDET